MNYDMQRGFAGARSGVEARIAFVRSVYLWLLGGFALAGMGAIGAWFSLPHLASLPVSPRAFMWILFIAQMGAVFFASAVSRKRPLNMVAFALFTVISGFIAGMVSIIVAAQSGFQIVLAAAGLTAVDFLVLTAIAFVSKKDFSFLRNFVIVGLVVMFFGGLIAAIFKLGMLSLIIAAVAVIACSAKILWDTSTMLRTDDLDDPAGFALSLFVSLYNIFLSLLRLLDRR